MELRVKLRKQRVETPAKERRLFVHLFVTVATSALLGYCAISLAGPFGYDQGMTREAVKKISKGVRDNKEMSTVQQPPIINESIQSLTLFFSKKSGLCFIIATGKPFFALSIEHDFTETVHVLSQKYGKPQIGFEPNRDERQPIPREEWYNAVMEQKGLLVAMWAEEGERRLPDKLRTVRLSLGVMPDFGKGAMGFLHFQYAFLNHEDCRRERRADRSKGL